MIYDLGGEGGRGEWGTICMIYDLGGEGVGESGG